MPHRLTDYQGFMAAALRAVRGGSLAEMRAAMSRAAAAWRQRQGRARNPSRMQRARSRFDGGRKGWQQYTQAVRAEKATGDPLYYADRHARRHDWKKGGTRWEDAQSRRAANPRAKRSVERATCPGCERQLSIPRGMTSGACPSCRMRVRVVQRSGASA